MGCQLPPVLLEPAVEVARGGRARGVRVIAVTSVEQSMAEPVDPAHLPAVLEGLAQAKRCEFATDDEVEAAFRHFDG